MAPLEAKKSVCNSCKGTDHRRTTSRLCPNSRKEKDKTARRIEAIREDTRILKGSLKTFEDFILKNKITMDDLAPAPCSNWMERDHYEGNSRKWKLVYYLRKKLIELQCDVAHDAAYKYLEENEVLNIVSDRTKTIFGIVGSNIADTWHSQAYHTAFSGTKRLMKIWGVTLEAENNNCRWCSS